MIDSMGRPALAGLKRSVVLLASLAAAVSLGAIQAQQTPQAPLAIHVTETAGIRRTMYPVSARVEVPEHALTDVGHVRLRSSGADVPAQFQVGSTWADGTVRLLDVDFN